MQHQHQLLLAACLVVLASSVEARTSAVALPDGKPYDVGNLTNALVIWVDSVGGVDAGRTGTDPAKPLKTFKAAWGKVPNVPTRPYIIRIRAGSFSQAQVPSTLEGKRGSYKAPILVQAATGAVVTFNAYVFVRNCAYIYFDRIRIAFAGNSDGDHPFHAEAVTGLLLRNVRVRGSKLCREVVKFNQCKGVYVEGCDIAEANDNVIDAVAVQYGHVINSKLHDVGFGEPYNGFGVYFKGGSAYIHFAGNEVYRTGLLGVAAGFDTGFEWLVSPWLRYEAYDIKIYNNVIHDVDGAAGVSVYGGHNILVAYNTLYRVGKSASLFHIRQGLRSCDDDYPERCTAYYNAGGWGQPGNMAKWAQILVPNKNVIIANNLAINPASYQTNDGVFSIREPKTQCDTENSSGPCKPVASLPATMLSDPGLVIRGNVVWDGPAENELGIHDEPGWVSGACRNTHPTCNKNVVRQLNDINNATAQPTLANPAGGDYHLSPGSLPAFGKLWAIPAFGSWAGGLNAPAGNLTNLIRFDKEGRPRTAGFNAPGALIRRFPPDRR